MLTIMDGKNVYAKAIYDNVAETEDELEFHRGDIILVIEQNTSGLEGWWLCSLNGKVGIAPANRLQLQSGVYKPPSPSAPGQEIYDVPPTHAWTRHGKSIFDDDDEEYDVPRNHPGLHHIMIDPSSPTEIYDVPRASNWQQFEHTGDEVYDVPPAVPASISRNREEGDDQDVYNVPTNLCAVKSPVDPAQIYDVPPVVSRGPQQNNSNPEEVYDVPPRRRDMLAAGALINMLPVEEVYDVPTSSLTPSLQNHLSLSHDSAQVAIRQQLTDTDVVYDIPQSSRVSPQTNIRSGLNSLRRMRRETKKTNDYIPSTSRKPEAVDNIYDVPPQVTRDLNHPPLKPVEDSDVVDGLLHRLSLTSNPNDTKASNRLSTISKDSFSSFVDDNPLQYSELKLDANMAISDLIALKVNLEDAVSRLLLLVKKNWRKKENIVAKLHDIQKCFFEILKTVDQFLMFARGATANAYVLEASGECRAPKNVQTGLRKLLIPVEEDSEMLKRALAELDNFGWNIDKLSLDESADDVIPVDNVDSFVMSSRAVSDDAAQLAVFIHTHAQYIFKKSAEHDLKESQMSKLAVEKERPRNEMQALQSRPLPSVPLMQNTSVVAPTSTVDSDEAWLEDYDYVALEDKDDAALNSGDSSCGMSGLNKRRTQLIALEKEWSVALSHTQSSKLDPNEKTALSQLQINIPELMKKLSEAIDRFIAAVDKGNPPNLFVALGKQVIFCAHKLVFAGDAVNLHVTVPSVKNAIQSHCENLCLAVKHAVVMVKLGALQWPSVSAVQEMVDRMYEISKCAHQMRLTMLSILSP